MGEKVRAEANSLSTNQVAEQLYGQNEHRYEHLLTSKANFACLGTRTLLHNLWSKTFGTETEEKDNQNDALKKVGWWLVTPHVGRHYSKYCNFLFSYHQRS